MADDEQLRVKNAVLKRAVKDGLKQIQDLTAALQQKDAALRQKENEVRKAIEDADNLQFHNNRLSKRVEQLLEEIETLKKAKAQTSRTWLFSKASAGSAEESELRRQIDLLGSDLQAKIVENAHLQTEIDEFRAEHTEVVAALRAQLNEAQAAHAAEMQRVSAAKAAAEAAAADALEQVKARDAEIQRLQAAVAASEAARQAAERAAAEELAAVRAERPQHAQSATVRRALVAALHTLSGRLGHAVPLAPVIQALLDGQPLVDPLHRCVAAAPGSSRALAAALRRVEAFGALLSDGPAPGVWQGLAVALRGVQTALREDAVPAAAGVLESVGELSDLAAAMDAAIAADEAAGRRSPQADGASFLATLAAQQDTTHRAFQQIISQLQGRIRELEAEVRAGQERCQLLDSEMQRQREVIALQQQLLQPQLEAAGLAAPAAAAPGAAVPNVAAVTADPAAVALLHSGPIAPPVLPAAGDSPPAVPASPLPPGPTGVAPVAAPSPVAAAPAAVRTPPAAVDQPSVAVDAQQVAEAERFFAQFASDDTALLHKALDEAEAAPEKPASVWVREPDGTVTRDARLSALERDRERELTEFYEARLRHLTQQVALADSKAVEFQLEWQRTNRHLEQVSRERVEALSKLKEALDTLERTKDELATTRHGYEQQIAMLSDHSVALGAEAKDARRELDALKDCRVLCGRCKNWNTVRWLLEEGDGGKRCARGPHPSSFNFG